MRLSKMMDYFFRCILPADKYLNYLRKKGVRIGTGCEIYRSVNFGSEPYLISIGNHVRINSGVQLVTHDGGYWVLREKKGGGFSDAEAFGTIRIGDNVHVGTNAMIMPGVCIGENSVIACGAVVTHDVPANTVAGGVPARPIETLEEYAAKAEAKAVMTKHMTEKEKRQYLEKKFHIKSLNCTNSVP